MAVDSMPIAHCKKFDLKGELSLNDGYILVDFLLLASRTCLSFSDKV